MIIKLKDSTERQFLGGKWKIEGECLLVELDSKTYPFLIKEIQYIDL